MTTTNFSIALESLSVASQGFFIGFISLAKFSYHLGVAARNKVEQDIQTTKDAVEFVQSLFDTCEYYLPVDVYETSPSRCDVLSEDYWELEFSGVLNDSGVSKDSEVFLGSLNPSEVYGVLGLLPPAKEFKTTQNSRKSSRKSPTTKKSPSPRKPRKATQKVQRVS